MTSFRQIEANTGPKTLNGKRSSRRNARRHGLTAETVIETAWAMSAGASGAVVSVCLLRH